jgi:hypothetical protein
MANMCAAMTSSMCTNPTVVFGYSPLSPGKDVQLGIRTNVLK